VTEETFDLMVAGESQGAFFESELPFLRPGSSVVLDASAVARKGWPNCTVFSHESGIGQFDQDNELGAHH
jgi:hypothetical protein